MKRTVCLIMLFTVVLLGYSEPAGAQFWKKWGKKEEKRKPAKKPVVKEKPVVKPVKKKREVNYPVSQKKARYRVDVLMPLYLDELVKDDKATFKGKLPSKAVASVDFYEGVRLAADTISRFAYEIDVYVHDVTNSANTPALLARKGLDSSDLIIGALPSNQVAAWAAYAKEQQVNFVSALSPSDADIKDNAYFTLLQPTLQTHCAHIMEIVAKKYPKNKPVLFYRTSVPVDQSAFNYLLEANKDVRQVLCNTLPKREQLKPLLDSTGTNAIVVGIIDNAYVAELLNHLQTLFPGYKFDVYGMPSWATMSALKKAGVYPDMTIYVTDPFYFDPTSSSGQALANLYKKEYGGNKPGEMVFRGYETLYWYAYLLQKYGNIFNEKIGDNGMAPFTRFNIKTKWDKDDNLLYNENQHVYMYRYQDGSYMIEQQ